MLMRLRDGLDLSALAGKWLWCYVLWCSS